MNLANDGGGLRSRQALPSRVLATPHLTIEPARVFSTEIMMGRRSLLTNSGGRGAGSPGYLGPVPKRTTPIPALSPYPGGTYGGRIIPRVGMEQGAVEKWLFPYFCG